MKLFLKIDKIVDKIQEFVCFLLFFGMVAVGGVSVFSRFILNLSITWAEELIRFLCIWLTFVGSALTVRKDGHVAIDIFISVIKNNKFRAVYYCVSRLIGIAFLLCLLGPSIELVQRTGNSMAAALPIKFSYIYLAVPVGIIGMLWAYITALPHYTKKHYEHHEEGLLDAIKAEEEKAETAARAALAEAEEKGE